MAMDEMMSSTPELHVLVADDDPSLLDLMTRRLMKMGITPDRASDGAEAQALIEKNSYDVIVTDIYMPEVTGLELLRIAREIDPNVQVVVATAAATIDNAVDALNNGAFGYLTKPFDHLSVFDKVVTRAMEFRRLLLDNQRMAEVQKRRGDMLEEEVTQRIRQLRDRQRDLLNLLTALPLGVTVVEEGGRVVMSNPQAEKWLAEEKHAKEQPIQEFMNSVHSTDAEPSLEVEFEGHLLRLTAVDILHGTPKKQKVVIIGEVGQEDGGISQGTMVEEAIDRLCEGLTWLASQRLESKAANVARGLVDDVVGLGRMMGMDIEDPVLPAFELQQAAVADMLENQPETHNSLTEDDEAEDERLLAALTAPSRPKAAPAEKPVAPPQDKPPAAREPISEAAGGARNRNGAQEPPMPEGDLASERPASKDIPSKATTPGARAARPEAEPPEGMESKPAPKVEKKAPVPERRLLRKAKELESGGWRSHSDSTPKSGANGEAHEELDPPPDESVLSRLARVTEDAPKGPPADTSDPWRSARSVAGPESGVDNAPKEAGPKWVAYEEGETEDANPDRSSSGWPPPLPSAADEEGDESSTEET